MATLWQSAPSNSSRMRRGQEERGDLWFLESVCSKRMQKYKHRHGGCTGVFLESQVERRKGREAEESRGLADHLMIAKLFEGGKGGIMAQCRIITR